MLNRKGRRWWQHCTGLWNVYTTHEPMRMGIYHMHFPLLFVSEHVVTRWTSIRIKVELSSMLRVQDVLRPFGQIFESFVTDEAAMAVVPIHQVIEITIDIINI